MSESVTLPTLAPEDVPLLPVRCLNEFTYCARLGYLEWAESQFVDNLDTKEGTFGHRNVDRPSHRAVPVIAEDAEVEEPPEPLHTRSLLISDSAEGLIARIDLLEQEGNAATPVDYKRGHVPSVSEGAWEPERVQLCAQGLILRGAGYHCTEGVLYYIASKRRVTIPFDDALIERTRSLAAEFRVVTARGQIPPPLVDSPKCPRCSLVGICLPDETNLLRDGDDSASQPPVRRLFPKRDDALPLYVQEQGTRVGKSAERLVIRQREETLHEAKLAQVSQVCLFGNVQISSQALRECLDRGIPVCHFSYGGWLAGISSGLCHRHGDLRILQHRLADDDHASLAFARDFILGKIKNQRVLLRRHLSTGPERTRCLDHLSDLTKQVERAASAESLLGFEGMAAKTYFQQFGKLLQRDGDRTFTGRNRRPPTDPVNAVLSFLYALLTKELTLVTQACGFDPMRGFLHRPRYGRPSLALDLAEEFRPLITDSATLMLFNNGEVSSKSFVSRAGSVALTPPGRRAVLAAFERRLSTEVTHPHFGYAISYRRVLEVQTRLLIRAIQGEIDRYPAFVTR